MYIPKPKGFFTEGKGADRKVHPISEPKGHRIAHSKHVNPSRDDVYNIHVQRRLRRHSEKSKVIVLSDEEWGISKPKTKVTSPHRPKKPRIERKVTPIEKKRKKKKIVKPPILKKVQCECGEWFLPSEIIKHTYTCSKFQKRWEVKPVEKRVPKPKPKPKRIQRPKKHKIKPAKPRMKMTHIEKMHLLASAKQFNIDPQEIDNTLTYYENKKHIHEMARSKGVSEMEISSSERESKEWASQYQEYLGNLKGELESAGYTVTESNM